MSPALKSAGEDKTEIARVQAIIIPGQALRVPQRHRQRHRKTLCSNEAAVL